MAEYIIGDVQGCNQSLQQLLKKIKFNKFVDRLWFVGDLVNRGADSLAVLRFITDLPIAPCVVLGNHDLDLLHKIYFHNPNLTDHTLNEIINSADKFAYAVWLRQQKLIYIENDLNIAITHAGIAPIWSLEQAQNYAAEVEQVLSSDNYLELLQHMYGDSPNWSNDLNGLLRFRTIINYFTRMRFCNLDGSLVFNYKGSIKNAPPNIFPWFELPTRKPIPIDLAFGHWAALDGICGAKNVYALDTGCVYGKKLTALRIDDKKKFSIACNKKGY